MTPREEREMRTGGKDKKILLWGILLLALSPLASGESVQALSAQKPRRLIAMTLATAEMLVDIAPRSRIVGLHKLAADAAYSNVAEKVRGIPLIGGGPERIISLRPDMVFAASYSSAALLNHLRAAKVPVFQFISFESLEDVFTNIKKMGRLIGEEDRARSLIARARAQVRAIRARIPRDEKPPRVLALLQGGWTPGSHTSLDAMIRLAGGENVAAARGVRGTRRISAEQIIAWRPDVIVTGVDPKSGESIKSALRSREVYAPLRNKRIIEIPRPRFSAVSQYIVHGLGDLARALRP